MSNKLVWKGYHYHLHVGPHYDRNAEDWPGLSDEQVERLGVLGREFIERIDAEFKNYSVGGGWGPDAAVDW